MTVSDLRNASAVLADPKEPANAEALAAYLGTKKEAEAHLRKLRKAWDDYFDRPRR